ncbi:MAG: LytTR family transcriptional regulator DNA-binding domain-containing protein [Fusobacteriaceae bacterium]|nr:LytTR family transcriptional regulator DNA-binding domain-containing protein [Fusobacteriaceae bacterium]
MDKITVFISHIHKDSDYAILLKKFLKNSFIGAIDFFVSSDRESITGGDKWLLKIENGIYKCSTMFILCSKDSIESSWVNFEAGGAWFSNKKVIPICLPDISIKNLPQPLYSLQSYKITEHNDIYDIIKLLSDDAGLQNPNVQIDDFLRNIVQIKSKKITKLKKQSYVINDSIPLTKNDETFIVEIGSIILFVSEMNEISVYTKNGKYKTKQCLNELENKFNGLFFRCHRSYLVNINYIEKLAPWIMPKSYVLTLKRYSENIPVSRNKVRQMKEILGIV